MSYADSKQLILVLHEVRGELYYQMFDSEAALAEARSIYGPKAIIVRGDNLVIEDYLNSERP